MSPLQIDFGIWAKRGSRFERLGSGFGEWECGWWLVCWFVNCSILVWTGGHFTLKDLEEPTWYRMKKDFANVREGLPAIGPILACKAPCRDLDSGFDRNVAHIGHSPVGGLYRGSAVARCCFPAGRSSSLSAKPLHSRNKHACALSDGVGTLSSASSAASWRSFSRQRPQSRRRVVWFVLTSAHDAERWWGHTGTKKEAGPHVLTYPLIFLVLLCSPPACDAQRLFA